MSPASQRDRPFRPTGGDATIRQAFDRALHHAQLAVAEGVSGFRAVLDAASIGVLGEPADQHPNLAELAKTLDQISQALQGDVPSFRNAAISTLLAAVDREIARWEVRSQRDPDARAVLRAFLGVREVLWELGFRRDEANEARPRDDARRRARSDPRPASTGRGAARRVRVQRIDIQG